MESKSTVTGQHSLLVFCKFVIPVEIVSQISKVNLF